MLLSPIDVRPPPQFTPLRCPASLLAHRLVSTTSLRSSAFSLAYCLVLGFDSSPSPSPPLVDIVLFGLPLKISHPYKEWFVLLPNRCGISLAYHPVSGSNTSPCPPLVDIVLFGLPLKIFKICLLGRGFHTFIKNDSFSSLTDVGSHLHIA